MVVDDLFEKDYKVLLPLSKLKLPIKKSIEKIILSQNYNDDITSIKNTNFFSIVEMWKGKILERTFAVRFKKNKDPEYQEVIRRLEGNSYCLIRNMYFSKMAGYRVVWKDSKPSYYLFNVNNFGKWIVYDKKYFRIITTRLYTLEDIVSLDFSLKYCFYNGGISLCDYITIYRRFPEIEMLSKLNAVNLCGSYKILENLKSKKFKKYLCKNNADGFLGRHNPSDILYGFNHNINLIQVDERKEENKRNKSKNKNAKIDKKMLEQAKRYEKLSGYFGNLKIIFPTSTFDLIKEGEELGHCVGKMNYNKKVAEDKTLILFVRKDEKKSLYTMEYNQHENKIVQFYGEHNSPVPADDKKQIETIWLKKAKQLKFN